MRQSYVQRAIEPELLSAAMEFPVLTLTGPRQTGKTTLLRTIFPDHAYASMDDPLLRERTKADPALFLENTADRNLIIDEIQYAPEILPYIKMAVDQDRARNGRFILTGSQVFPLMTGLSESLAGRTAIYELLGFAFAEIPRAYPISAATCFESIFRGFYPDPLLHGVDRNRYYGAYLQTYLERDIRQISSVHDLRIFQGYLGLLAARAGSLLNLNEVARECGISFNTAKRWLSLLEATRIVYLLKPYHKNISKRIVKSPKLYFTDTGLLAYLLQYPTARTVMSGPMAGAFFESMMVVEILKHKFNHNLLFEPYFYRDSNGYEIDLVLDFGMATALLELKATKSLRVEFVATMKRQRALFDNPRSCLLSFAEEECQLSPGIHARPWWKWTEIING
jgi:hypothetical protein